MTGPAEVAMSILILGIGNIITRDKGAYFIMTREAISQKELNLLILKMKDQCM